MRGLLDFTGFGVGDFQGFVFWFKGSRGSGVRISWIWCLGFGDSKRSQFEAQSLGCWDFRGSGGRVDFAFTRLKALGGW